MRTQIQHSEVAEIAVKAEGLTDLPPTIGTRRSRKPVYKPLIDRILADAAAGYEATVFGPFPDAIEVERMRSGVYTYARKNPNEGAFSFSVRETADGFMLYGWVLTEDDTSGS